MAKPKPYNDEIVESAARAMFVTSWADAWDNAVAEGVEKRTPWGPGAKLEDEAPPTPKDFIDDAEVFVRTTAFDNDTNLVGMANAHGVDYETFGWYLAMEGMGHGVGLSDYIEDHGLKIPHIEPILDIEDVRNYGFDGLSETSGRFRVGERVQLHPGTDRWMMGDRYGEVVKVTREYVHVKLDKSGKTMKFSENNLTALDGLDGLDGLGELSGADWALVRSFGLDENVVSTHRTKEAAEKAMRKHGGEPDSLFTRGMRVVNIGPEGRNEMIEIFGKRTIRPRR